MAWSTEKARQRIIKFKDSCPETGMRVEDMRSFLEGARALRGGVAAGSGELLLDIPRNRAITTHGVHIYANLLGFNDRLTDGGRETETSHERSLQFLHTHYSACDQLIRAFGIQRVDFHGSRLHAVVLTPLGSENEGERIRIAMEFSAAFREIVTRTASRFGQAYATGVRIGLDSGPAVAIDGGKRDEREPLFIGSPANHAAKYAAGDQDGIYPSPRVRAFIDSAYDLATNAVTGVSERTFVARDAASGPQVLARRRLEDAFRAFQDEYESRHASARIVEATFRFHHKEPPLASIQFAEHPPSNTIRMPLASIFADIDGFTAYVDRAMQTGRVAEAVSNLHVLRAEMAAVLRDDFGGRKIRFIGDCVHGLIAEGDARETDKPQTVEQAVVTAAGIRSSFELCQTLLPNIGELGLSIGIELGDTPICRLGLRGTESVRCASSRATCVSEEEQQRCNGRETAIGEVAYAEAPTPIRHAFAGGRKVSNLNTRNARVLIGTMASPTESTAAAPMRAHLPAAPMRAHLST